MLTWNTVTDVNKRLFTVAWNLREISALWFYGFQGGEWRKSTDNFFSNESGSYSYYWNLWNRYKIAYWPQSRIKTFGNDIQILLTVFRITSLNDRAKLDAHHVHCTGMGKPKNSLTLFHRLWEFSLKQGKRGTCIFLNKPIRTSK